MAYLFFCLLQGFFFFLKFTTVLLTLFCGENFLFENALIQGTDFSSSCNKLVFVRIILARISILFSNIWRKATALP